MCETITVPVARPALALPLASSAFMAIVLFAIFYPDHGMGIAFDRQFQSPTWQNWFGTDNLGRDVFSRTMAGLLLSLKIGGLASLFSGALAIIFTLFSSLNRYTQWMVALLVDMFMAIPHLLLLIIMTLAFGGGALGVIMAVALSHWPKLTRLLCEEVRSLMQCQFVQLSAQFGQPRLKILCSHIVPFVLPHCFIGVLLMIPHALIHVAGLTFLGFGLEPTSPSIGVLLAEASRYMLSGHWWLALFPGLTLLVVLLLLAVIGQQVVAHLQRRGY
ncbi:ABC transporter permease [Thaumasiovibrio sp. DFM-14]|uniref:ABC transporter permease n=1 Tax=Thaumasiovibrio sp. DFM-14 TaxID=3384792 RepID=UPI0039A0464F